MKHLLLLLTIALAVYFFIWRSLTPFPLQLNWDVYEHITLANKISQGHLSFFPSAVSDTFTFNGYSPLFHILLSLPKILLQLNLITIYPYLECGYFLSTVIVTFLLGRKIFSSNLIGFIAGLMSIFIFENFMVYTSLFLIPQNLAALLTILALYGLISNRGNKFFYLALSVFIFLMHFIIGFLGLLAILIFIFLRNKSLLSLNKLIICSLVILLVSGVLNYTGSWEITGREEAIHFTFSLAEKLKFMLDWYGLSILFLPLGIYAIWTTGTNSRKIILILGLIFLALSVSPIPYALKFFVYDHYFLNLIIAAGAGILIVNLPKFLKVLCITVLTWSLLIVFFKSESAYKEPLYFNGSQSHISYQELEAAKYLSKNFGSDTLLISDPSTQYILEAASGINTQGGAYADSQTRQILSEGLDLAKIRSIKDNLNYENANRKKTLLVIGGRYFAWKQLTKNQQMSFFYNIWQPQTIKPEDFPFIDSLLQNPDVKLVFLNDSLFIFEI